MSGKHITTSSTIRYTLKSSSSSMFSETLAVTYQTTWCHKPEDQNIKLHNRENITQLFS
jgi:hypothetical protein